MITWLSRWESWSVRICSFDYLLVYFDIYKMNHGIPWFLVKFWVLRFSHSLKVWVRLHMLWNFHILTPSNIWENWQFVNYEWTTARFYEVQKCCPHWQCVESGTRSLDSSVHKVTHTLCFGLMNCRTAHWLTCFNKSSSPCSVMYAWNSPVISRPILIIAELKIHDLKEEELHSNVM